MLITHREQARLRIFIINSKNLADTAHLFCKMQAHRRKVLFEHRYNFNVNETKAFKYWRIIARHENEALRFFFSPEDDERRNTRREIVHSDVSLLKLIIYGRSKKYRYA